MEEKKSGQTNANLFVEVYAKVVHPSSGPSYRRMRPSETPVYGPRPCASNVKLSGPRSSPCHLISPFFSLFSLSRGKSLSREAGGGSIYWGSNSDMSRPMESFMGSVPVNHATPATKRRLIIDKGVIFAKARYREKKLQSGGLSTDNREFFRLKRQFEDTTWLMELDTRTSFVTEINIDHTQIGKILFCATPAEIPSISRNLRHSDRNQVQRH